MGTDLVALPSTPEAIETIVKDCRKLVTKRALMSAGAVMVPIPGMDLAADVGLLLKLIPEINRRFGLTPEQIERLDTKKKVLVYKSIVSVGGAMIGRAITKDLVLKALQVVGVRLTVKQAARYIPVAGQMLSAALSWGAMRYVGESHIKECARVLEEVAGLPHGHARAHVPGKTGAAHAH